MTPADLAAAVMKVRVALTLSTDRAAGREFDAVVRHYEHEARTRRGDEITRETVVPR